MNAGSAFPRAQPAAGKNNEDLPAQRSDGQVSAHSWPADPVDLLAALYPHLLASARRIAPPRDSEDLVQETLLRVLVAHPDFTGIVHPLGYAKATLVRVATSKGWRKSVDCPPEALERLDDASSRAVQETVGSRMDLRDSISSLGRKQRACVYLRYVEELNDREIAALLGIRESTVRSQLSRALERLRRSWAAQNEEADHGEAS